MMRTVKVAAVLMMVLFTLLVACSKKKPTGPEPPKYKWTILAYFDGNNPQDETADGQSYVIRDVQELENIGSTDDVQILVMLGSFKTDGECKYYRIEEYPDEPEGVISSEVLQVLGKKDMSDPVTLRDFIGYGAQSFSAEHYMLIINDHANGWRGLCSDAVNGDGSRMILPEFSSALSGFGFDIVWFYTPSMAAAEAANQVKDRAEYMIASQFKHYPENIMGSGHWLPELVADPGINVREFARKVVEGVYLAAQAISPTKSVNSVLIHLPKIAQLGTRVTNLSTDLIYSAGSHWDEVWKAWEPSRVPLLTDSVYCDLREFARNIQDQPNLNSTIKADAQAVEAAVDDAVLLEKEHPDYGATGGISIHFPWDQDHFDSVAYAPLDFTQTGWDTFLSVFIQSYFSDYAGRLSIKSTPTGAAIYLDDVYTGDTTNAVVEPVFPGLHKVRVVKEGYHDYVWPQVRVLPRQTHYLEVTLTPKP